MDLINWSRDCEALLIDIDANFCEEFQPLKYQIFEMMNNGNKNQCEPDVYRWSERKSGSYTILHHLENVQAVINKSLINVPLDITLGGNEITFSVYEKDSPLSRLYGQKVWGKTILELLNERDLVLEVEFSEKNFKLKKSVDISQKNELFHARNYL